MAAVHDVVLGLATTRETAHATQLAKGVEAIETAGQQLVGVGLVAGVPDDAVGGAVEDAVEGDGELHHAERAAEVAAGGGHGIDDLAAELRAQGPGLRVADVVQFLRSLELA